MVRICVVGCGRIARSHLDAMRELAPRLRLAATVDLDEARAAEYAREYGAERHFAHAAEAAASADIDAAIICLPHNALTEVSRVFLAHGKHVLCEKPMGVAPDSLREVAALSERSSLVFQPGYVCRFMAPFVELKRRLDAGLLGDVRHMLSASQGFLEKPATPWWPSREKTGGFHLPVFSSHVLDRMLWVKGIAPTHVFGNLLSAMRGIEGESDGVAVLTFPDGAQGIISFSVTTPGNGLHLESVATDKATVQTTYHSLHIDGEPVALEETNAFGAQLRAFCSAVEQGRRSVPDARDGLRVLQLIQALQTSSSEQRVVRFEDEWAT